MESGQMYIGSDRRNQPKEPISVPRRIRRLVFRGFGTRMTEGTGKLVPSGLVPRIRRLALYPSHFVTENRVHDFRFLA